MQFNGKIVRVLPKRSGTSERTGHEWSALPFVFEYYEGKGQRFPDKVLLETFDTSMMRQMANYMVKGPDGKVVEENGSLKLTGDIPAKCGFGINVREYNGRTYNEIRMYLMAILDEQEQVEQPQPTADVEAAPSEAPFGQSEQTEELPF